MHSNPLGRRHFLRGLALSGTSLLVSRALGQERSDLKEPVFRVAKAANSTGEPASPNAHPLDPALEIAQDALTRIQRDLIDYTATIVKRERIKGQLGNYEYMFAKIRNRKVVDGRIKTPLSVYLRFLKPEDIKGREVVWVEGANGNKMRAHEGGLLGRTLPSVWLDPHGALAMRGQLHPITEIGIENLIVELIKRGEREKQYGECEVTFQKGAKINGRPCTVLSVRHPEPREYFEFHLAQIFIDDEYNLPVRYAAFHWPTRKDDQTGPVLEEYTYLDLKINVGLTDADFDSENPNYNF
jgi:hypothetical protein